MPHPQTANERFLASAGDPMTFHEMTLLMKKEFGDQAKQVTTKVYSNWLVRIMALINPAAKGIAPNLGKTTLSQNDKATKLLGWEPRSREEGSGFGCIYSCEYVIPVDMG